MFFFPELHICSVDFDLFDCDLNEEKPTCGLNCPGPGSAAASLMVSSKLLCFMIYFSLSILALEYLFIVPRSVYFVRSNFPTPGGLCLA